MAKNDLPDLPEDDPNHLNDERLSAVARGLVGILPLGSLLVELFEQIRNEPNEQKRKQWLQALADRVNELQSRADEAEGETLTFKIDAHGIPDIDTIAASASGVMSLTDDGENDFTITFAADLPTNRVVIQPVSESPVIKLIEASAGGLRFSLPESQRSPGQLYEMNIRALRPAAER